LTTTFLAGEYGFLLHGGLLAEFYIRALKAIGLTKQIFYIILHRVVTLYKERQERKWISIVHPHFRGLWMPLAVSIGHYGHGSFTPRVTQPVRRVSERPIKPCC
jgi:hypothetical protein